MTVENAGQSFAFESGFFTVAVSLVIVLFFSVYLPIFVLGRLSEKIFLRIRVHLVNRFFLSGSKYAKNLGAGRFVAFMNNCQNLIQNVFQRGLPLLLQSFFVLFGSFMVLLCLSVKLTLYVSFWWLLIAAILRSCLPHLTALWPNYQQSLAEVSQSVTPHFIQSTSPSCRSIIEEKENVKTLSEAACSLGIARVSSEAWVILLCSFVALADVFSARIFSDTALFQGELSAAQATTYMLCLLTVTGSIGGGVSGLLILLRGLTATRRLLRLFLLTPFISRKCFDGGLSLTCEKVSQKHGEKVLFGNVSCIIEPRKKVAVVGAAGSGKTIFLKLLSSNLHADEGDIYLGKQKLNQLSKNASWPYMISLWSFGVYAWRSGSIIDNITRGVLISEEALTRILTCVGIASFSQEVFHDISSIDLKNRVMWARLLICRPPIVLIDDFDLIVSTLGITPVLLLETLSFATVFVVGSSDTTRSVVDYQLLLGRSSHLVPSRAKKG